MIKKYYKNSWKIIKENRKIILIMASIYVLFFIIGTIYSLNHSSYSFSSEDAKNAYEEYFITTTFKQTFLGNFQYIFFHNVVANLYGIMTGIVFAIIPVGVIISMGVSNSMVIISSEYGFWRTLFSFVPHSIFEIPAIILSSSLGVMIFFSIFKSKDKKKDITQAYKNALLVFLLIILPLLLIAGIIEALEIMIFYFW